MKTLQQFTPLLLVLACSCSLGTACRQQGGSSDDAKDTVTADSSSLDLSRITRVLGIGRVEPEWEVVDLYPEVAGVVEQVWVRESDLVKAGDRLVTLDRSLEEARLARIRAQIGENRQQVMALQAEADKASVRAASLKRTWERRRAAAEQQAEPREAADQAESEWQESQSELKRLQFKLEEARAAGRTLEADLRVSAIEADRKQVRARTRGQILRMDVSPGAMVRPETKLGELAPESPLTVRTEIDELFADRIRTGQSAYILNQGQTDTIATGKVLLVAPNLKQKSIFSDEIGKLEDRRIREVRIQIDTPTRKPLLLGARVECLIRLTN